jgi:tetratricopeptide (TPR) repeat protein
MTNADQHLMTLFAAALDYGSDAERTAYLDRACADDPVVRERLEALLRAHGGAGRFLEAAPDNTPTADAPPAGPVAGAVLGGRFKLLEVIGEGGMGEVWLAQQQEPVRRPVALKVIKAGMDTRSVLARFEAERQALALMDHPNIAKVLDGGATPTGRPFFVMELVKGTPITQYCDEHRLTPRQRLDLFVPVCQAVQHAHQKGVIHRDLKPSNVLVAPYDGRPVPKVIDFGVAKAAGQPLTDKTLVTGLGAAVGTPEYMSPEQAELNNQDIDTRSDIYSLGVLLYELLTGSPPFTRRELERAGMLEMLRVIREQEPSRPSTKLSTAEGLPALAANRGTEPAKLTKLVRGELDWIVMKALEKDRARRYETANGFAADVQRYLADEPVQACPPSAAYRLRKFARRNRGRLVAGGVLAAALLVALGAVAGSVGWAWRDRAARQATIVGQVDQLLDESATLYRQRKLPEATQMARNALALADGAAGDPEAARRAREWLQDLDMVARLEEIHPRADGVWKEKLVEYPQAFREYGIDIEALTPEEEAIRIAARPIRVDLAVALDRWVGYVYNWGGHMGLGGEKGVALRDRLRQIARLADPDPLRNRVRGMSDEVERRQGDGKDIQAVAASVDLASTPIVTLMVIGDALDWDRQLAFYARVQQQHPGDFGVTFELGRRLFWSSVKGNGDLDSPIRFLAAAVAIRPQSYFARKMLADALHNKGHVDEAIAAYRAADRINGRPINQVQIGKLMLQAGREQEAAAEFREALRLTSKAAEVHREIGWAYAEVGKYDAAIGAYREALLLQPDMAEAHHGVGIALEKKGLGNDAIAAHRDAVRFSPKHGFYHQALGLALCSKGLHDEGFTAQREAIRLSPGYAPFHNDLGNTLSNAGRGDEAIAEYREAIRLKPEDAVIHYNLGHELWRKNELDAAIVVFRGSIRLKPDYADAHLGLGVALEQKGLLDDAIAARREAVRLAPKDAKFRSWLGEALKNKGLLIGAIAAYSEAVRLAPKDADAHVGLGSALQKKGLVDDAILEYREAIRLQPDRANAHHWLGTALQEKRLVGDAIAAHREAVRLQPDEALHHWWLASALQAKDLWEDAIDEYLVAICFQPDMALAHSGLGSALDKKGLVADAIAAYREASRLQPDSPGISFGLGGVHARVGQWGPAAAAFARGLEIDKDPNNLRAWYVGLPLLLAARDEAGYRRLCRQMLERFGQSKDLITAEWTAKTCALIPDAVADFKPVEQLADRLVTGTEKHPSYRFFVLVKALVEYRAGRPAEAVRWAERYAPSAGGNEFDAFVFATLSMARHRQGNADKARAALASAKAILTRRMPDPANGRPFTAWHEWLHADVLVREAEALVKE